MYLRVFFTGGLICALGELLLLTTKLTSARILVLFVSVGVILGAVGIYEPFAQWAGAGATTPLTGFGYTLVKGTREAVQEKGLLGALTGGLTAAAGGISAATVFGFLAGLLFRPDTKK